MNHFQRLAQRVKNLFAKKESNPNPQEPLPAGMPPKETNPDPENPPAAGVPSSEKPELAAVSVASAESKEEN